MRKESYIFLNVEKDQGDIRDKTTIYVHKRHGCLAMLYCGIKSTRIRYWRGRSGNFRDQSELDIFNIHVKQSREEPSTHAPIQIKHLLKVTSCLKRNVVSWIFIQTQTTSFVMSFLHES